ncbi:MAG TPA: hypothetical protein VFU02_21570 [Polyangiaceae bacterium]|nr:hypothetical protein [Polyangiaceae bacterium]
MTEVLGDEPVNKLESDIASALRRRQAHEAQLAGIVREVARFSPRLLQALERSVALLVKRGSFDRLLYAAAARTLAECHEEAVVQHLSAAVSDESAGGLASLSAASMTRSPGLTAALARAAANRHPHLVLAAEVARVQRGESDGQHGASVAPMIKESCRISLCAQVFVPLLWRPALPSQARAGIAVLRGAERHLGRWLVLAELGRRAGDTTARAEALERAGKGSRGTRAAWGLAAWSLGATLAPPSARPTSALVGRLSDRPAADADTSFLFRMADARLSAARPMLETMSTPPGLNDPTAIRAALVLSQGYARGDLVERLVAAARCQRNEALRGLAAAALFDLGQRDLAGSFADELVNSKKLPTLGWAALIRAAGAGKIGALVTEPTFRRVQHGWSE